MPPHDRATALAQMRPAQREMALDLLDPEEKADALALMLFIETNAAMEAIPPNTAEVMAAMPAVDRAATLVALGPRERLELLAEMAEIMEEGAHRETIAYMFDSEALSGAAGEALFASLGLPDKAAAVMGMSVDERAEVHPPVPFVVRGSLGRATAGAHGRVHGGEARVPPRVVAFYIDYAAELQLCTRTLLLKGLSPEDQTDVLAQILTEAHAAPP
jgi:hypothetical protein